MGWWGKALGGAFGMVMGGPLGALLGTAAGHGFDKGLERWRDEPAGPAEREQIQTAFFTTTFAVMGHLAKADGRVTQDEIGFAEAVMAHMALNAEQRRVAIDLFRQGKAQDFPLDKSLEQFRRICRRRLSLLRMFLEIQVQAAYADGQMAAAERQLLLRMFDRLGLSAWELDHIEALVRASGSFAGGRADARRPGSARRPPPTRRNTVADAYGVLGVSRDASDAEVKRAYRRLMNQHHPDKLVAKGLPEEMVRLANDKVQEIKNAYEAVKQARGMR